MVLYSAGIFIFFRCYVSKILFFAYLFLFWDIHIDWNGGSDHEPFLYLELPIDQKTLETRNVPENSKSENMTFLDWFEEIWCRPKETLPVTTPYFWMNSMETVTISLEDQNLSQCFALTVIMQAI
ncbi:hypothetical protein CEXT_716091 [Caerostris extrusa]|uniref:Uncharacterized protein n=1 Tax=Caerostris extrusa TaxID=172846 RepID=A0AAV4Y8R6_CAEEX|nr:hypothetical protein CEXT_716091 [Caerostris extrusa]